MTLRYNPITEQYLYEYGRCACTTVSSASLPSATILESGEDIVLSVNPVTRATVISAIVPKYRAGTNVTFNVDALTDEIVINCTASGSGTVVTGVDSAYVTSAVAAALSSAFLADAAVIQSATNLDAVVLSAAVTSATNVASAMIADAVISGGTTVDFSFNDYAADTTAYPDPVITSGGYVTE